MAMIRISGLGITVLGSVMLLGFAGCDSGGSSLAAPGGSGNSNTGGSGATTNGGSGNNSATGGHVATTTGGHVATTTGGSVTTGVGGGGNTTSSGCSTAPTATGTLSIASNYITGSNYSGYGYAFIAPSTTVGGTTANCTLGGTDALCAAGTLPADSSYGTVAGIGLNLNQSSAANSTANALSITVSSVTVGFTNPGASTLRVQVSQVTPTATTYYCYDVSTATSPVTLSPSQFNSACWNGSGTAWDGTDAAAVQLVVPSQATVATPFSACLTSVTLS